MILTCPRCATRFLVNSAAIGAAGREVRCGRCGNAWFAAEDGGVEAAVAPAPPAEPEPAPLPDAEDSSEDRPPPAQELSIHAEKPLGPVRSAPPRANVPPDDPNRRRWPVRMAWVALIAVLIGIGAAASLYREEVIAVLPAAEPAYAAIGIESEPPGFGLNLIIETFDRSEQDGQIILRVSGRIENATGTRLRVPALRAALFDAEQRELQGWTVPAPVASLPPNGNERFKTEFANPAENAVRLSIVFQENR